MRIVITGVVLLACVALGAWLGLRASVRLGYREETHLDRRTGAILLWLVLVCAAAIGFFYAVK
jgi:hypothetical protein